VTQRKSRLTISDNGSVRAVLRAALAGPALARTVFAGTALVRTVLVGAVLAGCVSGPNLDPAPVAGTTLAGVWKLDPALSDDPKKVFAKAVPKRSPQQVPGTMGGRRRGGRGGQNPRPDDTPDDTLGGYPAGYPGDPYGGRDFRDPLQRSPYAPMLEDDAFRSEVITIKQSPSAFIIDYGSSTRRLTPGSKSVVSDVRGVADQSTGWSGKEYVIDKRSQDGPNVSEHYSLANGGKQLVVKMTMGGNGFPAVKLTRVYDAAGAQTRGFPTND
jgi:hypothetical protein